MEFNSLTDYLWFWMITSVCVFLGIKIQQWFQKLGQYNLSCKYPGCHFKMTVSDKKYAYLCDEVMADHQNRFHPLEFKETY